MQSKIFINNKEAIAIGDRFFVVCLRFPESKKRNIRGETEAKGFGQEE
ncbi:hypothetical protein HCU40_05220 [Pseudanabaena biceps]|nr:hypothetical protein [Pseudanabaena biceps]